MRLPHIKRIRRRLSVQLKNIFSFFVKQFADCNEYTAENVYKQAFEKVRHMKISVSAHKDYTDYEKENTRLAEHV